MNVQGNGRHIERGMLCLPGPSKLRVQVRIVGVSLLLFVGISVRCNQANGRVVQPFLVVVCVGLDVALVVVLASSHPLPLAAFRPQILAKRIVLQKQN